MSKSAIGAGALLLPAALAKLGLVPGLATLVCASITATIGLHFLSRLAANTDQSDYFALGKLAYGTVGEVFCMAALLLSLFGTLIFYIASAAESFLNFLKYVRPSVDLNSSLLVNVTCCITAAVIFPLAAQRDMSALAKASIGGMACMVYIALLLLGDYLYDLLTGHAQAPIAAFTPFVFGKFFTTFSGVIFAFVNHFTMPPVICNLIDPTPSRRSQLTFGSAAAVIGYYLVFSLAGYLHFGSGVASIVLNSPQPTSAVVDFAYVLAKLLVGVMLVLSYPLILDPCRATIEGVINLVRGTPGARSSSLSSLAITGALVGAPLLVGIFCRKLALMILSLFTGLSGSLLLFVFPSLFFLALQSKYRVSPLERIAAYFNILFGMVILVGSTYYNCVDVYTELFGAV